MGVSFCMQYIIGCVQTCRLVRAVAIFQFTMFPPSPAVVDAIAGARLCQAHMWNMVAEVREVKKCELVSYTVYMCLEV